MSPPGARLWAVMSRVGLTLGQPARRDARGEPDPPTHPHPSLLYGLHQRVHTPRLPHTLFTHRGGRGGEVLIFGCFDFNLSILLI